MENASPAVRNSRPGGFKGKRPKSGLDLSSRRKSEWWNNGAKRISANRGEARIPRVLPRAPESTLDKLNTERRAHGSTKRSLAQAQLQCDQLFVEKQGRKSAEKDLRRHKLRCGERHVDIGKPPWSQ